MSNKLISHSQLIDTHCHVDLFPNPALLVRAIDKHRVHTIAVTNAPSVFEYTERLACESRYMHPAAGLHPELVATHEKELIRLWPLLARTKFVGEVGLDYSTSDQSLRTRQRIVFSEILERCASFGDKVITVHSRRAALDAITAIGRGYPGRIILHWFSGTMRELDRAIQFGCCFSVNLAMVKSKKGRELIMAMPRSRVLTESDGPFVQTAEGTAAPESMATLVNALAAIWQVAPDQASKAIAENMTFS